MTQIDGFYYAENASKKHDAKLHSSDGIIKLVIANEIVFSSHFSELSISERLGNTPRQIRFSNGSLFETGANDEVDALLRLHTNPSWFNILHILESKTVFLIPLLITAIISGWLTYAWGLPKLSQSIAFSLPASELGIIGEHTLKALDETYLLPTKLSIDTQQEIRTRFDKLTSEIGSGFIYKLNFRQLPNNTANAFALPDGSVVLMDDLVHLASYPWEVDSILLHEIAHIEKRHGLQMAFQDTLITLSVSLMLGDAVSAGDAVMTLPVLLLENQYSQNFELASDDFASNYMLNHQIDTIHFSNMLLKLHASSPENEDKAQNTEPSFWDYFSTHPQMGNRISRIQEKVVRIE